VVTAERVVVLGAGLMGAQIGAEYALAGHTVTLVTRTRASGQAARARAADALRFLSSCGLTGEASLAAAARRIAANVDIAASCKGATIIVESLPEDIRLKTAVLGEAAGAAPRAILASNTSSLSITKIGASIKAGTRLIGTHYWNPPTLMPLVEVVAGRETAPRVRQRVSALLKAMGKEPVHVADVPGFLWNRLQLALLREAVSLVHKGVATPEGIDLALRRGLGRRWSVVGPFEAMALGGRRTFLAVASQVFPELACDVKPEALLSIRLARGKGLARIRYHRDAKLAQLLREDRHPLIEPVLRSSAE
jgi:3-hydroxybutyryl-CoA dehydrogenase